MSAVPWYIIKDDIKRVMDVVARGRYNREDALLDKPELIIWLASRTVVPSEMQKLLPAELLAALDFRSGTCWTTDWGVVIISAKPYCDYCEEYGHSCGDGG